MRLCTFAAGKWTTDQIPLDRLISNAVVVDVSAASAANVDYQVSVTDFTGWEATHGAIAPDIIGLIRTDFAKRWPDARRYLGTTLSIMNQNTIRAYSKGA